MECTNGVGQKFDDDKQDWFLLPLEILEPLADVMLIGEKKGYGNFSCLGSFDNSNRRFYNGQMRHTRSSQTNPLAINIEKDKTGNEIGRCYHLAGVAFNALMRLHHAIKERGHAHDYLKPNKDETGVPDTGLGCPSASGISLFLHRDKKFVDSHASVCEFLSGFGVPPSKIHYAVLPEDGEQATECDDESCSCHDQAGADGGNVEEGIEREPISPWRPWPFEGCLPGTGSTLGQSAKTPDVTSAPERKNIERPNWLKRKPPYGRPEI